MQLVILAGGLGTRISEETGTKPKPMIEIGGKPILWHIMKIYSFYGIREFIICCGFKGYVIKEYFANYFLHNSDVTFDIVNENAMQTHNYKAENWKVTLVDTGEMTQTAGRLKRVEKYICNDHLLFTYGDGVADINIDYLTECHLNSKAQVTLTAVQPPGRYGALKMDGANVISFQEKPDGDNAWINGGFFVLNKSIFRMIENDSASFEEDVLPTVAKQGNLNAYKHNGFWQPMDTLRDKNRLEYLWSTNSAKWKVWAH